jgi:hypothetical protein
MAYTCADNALEKKPKKWDLENINEMEAKKC